MGSQGHRWHRALALSSLCCDCHGIDNTAVARTTAQVSRKPFLDLFFTGMWIARQQISRGDDHARNAEAALYRAGFDKRLLYRIHLTVATQPLDGDDVRPIALHREHETRVDGTPVQHHRARAALAFGTALLRAGEIQLIAQSLEQRVVR